MCCIMCPRMTETKNVTTFTSKYKRLMKRGQCVICGRIKTQFIKIDATGGNFLNTTINKLPFELHVPGHNFTGPCTKLDKRLNADRTPKNGECQSIELIMQRITTSYTNLNIVILKLEMMFVIKLC